jgi:bifunctional DNase/RNase
MFEEMNLSSLSYDMVTGEPLIVLKDSDKTRSFLVNGKNQDVRYLMSEFSGTLADASSPYSIVLGIIDQFNGNVVRLEIQPDENGMQSGVIYIENGKDVLYQPCRAVDIVVLSSKISIPVHVSVELLQQSEFSVSERPTCSRMKSDKDMLPPHGGIDNEFLM